MKKWLEDALLTSGSCFYSFSLFILHSAFLFIFSRVLRDSICRYVVDVLMIFPSDINWHWTRNSKGLALEFLSPFAHGLIHVFLPHGFAVWRRNQTWGFNLADVQS